jgi:hypothetical protein
VVHVWSTPHRNRAVPNSHQRYIVAQVYGASLRKQARVQNPDKDEVQIKAGGRKPTWVALVPAALAAVITTGAVRWRLDLGSA